MLLTTRGTVDSFGTAILMNMFTSCTSQNVTVFVKTVLNSTFEIGISQNTILKY